VLEYAINRTDDVHSKNKVLMDEVNNKYSNILRKV
jgi:hypothetical protein